MVLIDKFKLSGGIFFNSLVLFSKGAFFSVMLQLVKKKDQNYIKSFVHSSVTSAKTQFGLVLPRVFSNVQISCIFKVSDFFLMRFC